MSSRLMLRSLLVLAACAWLVSPQLAHAASRDSCFAKIKDIVSSHLGVDPKKVTPSAKFTDDLKVDDLDVTELVLAMEEEFGVEISDADAKNLNTTGDLANYVSSHSRCQSVQPPASAKATADGHWMVITGSWPVSQQDKVTTRMKVLSKNGIAARSIKTDDYPGLTPGLVAVVLGPMGKEAAQAQLDTIQPLFPDAFIKESN